MSCLNLSISITRHSRQDPDRRTATDVLLGAQMVKPTVEAPG